MIAEDNKQPFAIHAARRKEMLRFSRMQEHSAIAGAEEFLALQRRSAANGGALGGGFLRQDLRNQVVHAKRMIEETISYRKELAERVPELLDEDHLLDLRAKLDSLADGIIMGMTMRYHPQSPAGRMFPAGALDALIGEAARNVSQIKSDNQHEIEMMNLDRSIPAMKRNDITQINNITAHHIGALNTGKVMGNVKGSIKNLESAGQASLGEAISKLAAAIESSTSEPAAKNDVIESLTYVSEQALLPHEARKFGPLKSCLKSVKDFATTAAPLVELYLKVEQALKASGIHL